MEDLKKFHYPRDDEKTETVGAWMDEVLDRATPLKGHSPKYISAVGYMMAMQQLIRSTHDLGYGILMSDKWVRIFDGKTWYQLAPSDAHQLFRRQAKTCGLEIHKNLSLLMAGYLKVLSKGLAPTLGNIEKVYRRVQSAWMEEETKEPMSFFKRKAQK